MGDVSVLFFWHVHLEHTKIGPFYTISCSRFRISKCSSDVCFIRFDFVEQDVAPPDILPGQNGDCTQDQIQFGY